jgi:hypothetical protein
MPVTLLESSIASINANAFFPEFTFAATAFPVPGQGERELADHIVLIGDVGMIFQMKEREPQPSDTSDEVQRWFDKKVRKKAVTQLRDTRQMLRAFGGMTLPNQAGHLVPVDPPNIDSLVGIVVYRSAIPVSATLRVYDSTSAGLVHFLSDAEYAEVCRVLSTPIEILDYLTFRATMANTHASVTAAVTERALLGQFIAEESDAVPSAHYEAVFDAWRDDASAYDLAWMLRQLGARVMYREGADVSETSHHSILREFAMLSRSELAMFKTYLRLSLEAVRADKYALPYRMFVPRRQCGFAVIPMTTDMAPEARRFLTSMGQVSKHVFQATRHIALSIVQRDGAIDIEWMYAEGSPQPNPELEAKLAEYWPFRTSSERNMPRYFFDTDALNRVLPPRPTS